MAQLSANREPTMEEILASIRRIIESNEPAENEETARATPELELEPESEPHAPAPRTESRSPSEPVAAATAAPADRAESRPVSLADVAARVRASGSAPLAARPVAAAPQSHGAAALRVEPHFDDDETEADADEADDLRPAARTVPSVEADTPTIEPETETETDSDGTDDAVFAAANDSEKEAASPPTSRSGAGFDDAIRAAVSASMRTEPAAAEKPAEPAVESEPAPQQQPEASRPLVQALRPEETRQLLSPMAGAKVAAAFDDLTEAFQAPRRSFDEIAEEMLRPMLQEWLDDNLPTLVEKLVREEIERVARGGRR